MSESVNLNEQMFRAVDLYSVSDKLDDVVEYIRSWDLPEPGLAALETMEDLLRRATTSEVKLLIRCRWHLWNGKGAAWDYILDPPEIDPSFRFFRFATFSPDEQTSAFLFLYQLFLTAWRNGEDERFPMLILSLKDRLDSLMKNWPLWSLAKERHAQAFVENDLKITSKYIQ